MVRWVSRSTVLSMVVLLLRFHACVRVSDSRRWRWRSSGLRERCMFRLLGRRCGGVGCTIYTQCFGDGWQRLSDCLLNVLLLVFCACLVRSKRRMMTGLNRRQIVCVLLSWRLTWMTVGRRWSWWVAMLDGARRERRNGHRLWGACVSVLVRILFPFNFLVVQVTQGGQLRSLQVVSTLCFCIKQIESRRGRRIYIPRVRSVHGECL